MVYVNHVIYYFSKLWGQHGPIKYIEVFIYSTWTLLTTKLYQCVEYELLWFKMGKNLLIYARIQRLFYIKIYKIKYLMYIKWVFLRKCKIRQKPRWLCRWRNNHANLVLPFNLVRQGRTWQEMSSLLWRVESIREPPSWTSVEDIWWPGSTCPVSILKVQKEFEPMTEDTAWLSAWHR